MVELVLIGILYETVIIIITIILLILVFKKYLIKKHRFTLILFFIFFNFLIAIFFSWLSKILVTYSGIAYLEVDNTKDPGTPMSWILFRITNFRISFVFVTIAVFLSYVLKVNVFEKDYKPVQRIIVIIYGSFIALYELLVYQRGNSLLDILAFFFVLIYMVMIYFPFLIRSLENHRKATDPTYKRAFLSLALMSLFLILVFVNLLIDQILIFIGFPSYTIFYFLAWTSSVIGVIFAYLGYIRPKSKENNN